MLERDMVALIRETKYDVAQDKYLTNFSTAIYLKGNGDHVEKAKQEVEAFIKGLAVTYKSDWSVEKI